MTTGVLLAAFGAPESFDAITPFIRSVMGREPSPEAQESARLRYLTIGGSSPLPLIVERMAAALERRLSGLPDSEGPTGDEEAGVGALVSASKRATEGVPVPVAVGMLHSQPSIDAAVERLAAVGVDRLVWVGLSPFDSSVTTGAIRSAVSEACSRVSVVCVAASEYRDSDSFVTLLADACIQASGGLVSEHNPVVVFTAHSLPIDDAGVEDYVAQLEHLSTRVAEVAGLGSPGLGQIDQALGLRAHGGAGNGTPWLLAYQSKGLRGGDWLEPDLDAVVGAAFAANHGSVAVCPIGFVVEHLETLYDLDVEATEKAFSYDMEFARARVPNDDPRMIEILENAVRPHL
jgi:ferrochelatase